MGLQAVEGGRSLRGSRNQASDPGRLTLAGLEAATQREVKVDPAGQLLVANP